MNPLYPGLAIAGVFAVLFILERRFPLRRQRHPGLRRLAVNLGVSALALATAFALVKPAATMSAAYSETARFGLLQWAGLPPALSFVAGFLLLDLSFYFWHFANHRLPLLWRFHIVHHIDVDLDVSTAFRFHFGEVALSAGFRVVQMLLIGPSFITIAIYELVFQSNTLFHHSNVRLPIRVERLLNRVLVTPRMHGIHHSMVRRENTSNFSVVFSFWDRLRHTLVVNIPQQEIVVGIPAYEKSADNTLRTLVLLPFHHQPDPWHRADGTDVTREPYEVERRANVLLA